MSIIRLRTGSKPYRQILPSQTATSKSAVARVHNQQRGAPAERAVALERRYRLNLVGAMDRPRASLGEAEVLSRTVPATSSMGTFGSTRR
jgi:DMSO/TMAO reductase YedYZ molybdopterin-dependent catalytic subunit